MKQKGAFPFDPSRLPFFYGWVVLIAGTVGVLMSVPGQTVGVSAFTESLLKDLAVDRDNLSLAYLFGTVASGLMITRAGKLYDSYGARIMAFIAGLMLGVMLLYLTRVDRIAGFIQQAEWVSPSLATFLLLIIGFWGIRFFGQGMLTMVSRNMVMKWFDKRRGLANAFVGIVTAFGFSLSPRIFNGIIERYEWRGAWVFLALMVGVLFVIFVIVFFRDNPECCGLKPDGRLREGKGRKRPPSLPDRDFTLKEARKTRSFWAFTLGLSLAALYVTGLTFHIVSIFETNGFSETKALAIFLPASFIAMGIQFGFGYLSDFMKLKYLLLIFLGGMALTSAGLVLLKQGAIPYWMIISGNGIVWGLYAVLIGVTWPRFYGLKHLGAISGFSMSITVIGSALGPYMFSLSFNYLGGYTAAAWVCLAISAALIMLSLKAENPGKGTL